MSNVRNRRASGADKESMNRFLAPLATLASSVALLLACAHPAPLPPKALELNRDGAAALASGDLTTAEARIALALEYNPRFTEAWVNLGLIELRRGNFEKARRDFVKARDLNPDLPAPHHALGLLADKEAHGAIAEQHYRAALKVDPGFAPSRVNLGRRLFERGAFEEAREQFLRLTQVAPEVVDGYAGLCDALLRLERMTEAEDVLASARERFGDHPGLVLIEARLLMHDEAFAEAEERLMPITRSADRPRAAAAWAWIAVARAARDDRAGATSAARNALAINPDESVARYTLRALGAGASGATL